MITLSGGETETQDKEFLKQHEEVLYIWQAREKEESVKWAEKLAGSCKIKPYSTKEDFKQATAIFIGGGSTEKLTEFLQGIKEELKEWVTQGKPLLGVSAGARALGTEGIGILPFPIRVHSHQLEIPEGTHITITKEVKTK